MGSDVDLTSANRNGRVPGAGITHPSLDGQANVIKEAYRISGGLNPLLTGYFECHGENFSPKLS